MKSQNKARSKRRKRCQWQIPVLIVLVILLMGAVGVAFWLSQDGEIPQIESILGTKPSEQLAPENTEIPVDTDVSVLATDGTTQLDTPDAPDSQQTTQLPEQAKPSQNSGTASQSGDSSSGNSSAPVYTPIVIPTEPPEQVVTEKKDVLCEMYSLFTGQYAEDGRDELVTNVAAILVTNNSDRFLDLGTISYQIDGRDAAFVVTGLPAGRSAWVMEANRMTATNDSEFSYVGITTAFRDDVKSTAKEVTITADGNMLTAKNNSDKTLENVFIYYRTLHTDGNFFGGITYLVDFGTLKAGEAVTKMGGHYGTDSEIIRIGWLTE